MIKIVNLVGARPQFIKAATISRVWAKKFADSVDEIVVHSGQHYDSNLSEVFFEQLRIPKPHYQFNCAQSNNSEQAQCIKLQLDEVLRIEKPDAVILYGDTTTTLAGAQAAAALNIPIAHVEAGLRSYNREMPEERNRVETDRLSSFLFVPTAEATANLKKEGIENQQPEFPVVAEVGDCMIDSLRVFGQEAQLKLEISDALNGKPILLVTVHRNYNADHPEKMDALLEALEAQTDLYQVVFPVHPRTAKQINSTNSAITFLPPVSYLDMLALEQSAAMIITDSGGVQKEAYYFKKPLIIVRSETEWTELIDSGMAVLSGVTKTEIQAAIDFFLARPYRSNPDIYGDGYAADRMCEILYNALV